MVGQQSSNAIFLIMLLAAVSLFQSLLVLKSSVAADNNWLQAVNGGLRKNSTDETISDRSPPTPQNQDPLLKSNTSQYTWTGNRFIPPSGVPTFRPSEYLSYFSRRNVLVIGDSTGRRAYGTLFGMMTSSDHSNIPTAELDSKNVIDFNKKGTRKEECMIPERSFYGYGPFVCRNLSDHHSIAPHEDNKKKEEINNTISIGNEGKDKGIGHINSGKFDSFTWYLGRYEKQRLQIGCT